MRRTIGLLLLGALACGAQTGAKHRVLFNRYRVPEIGLFIADADGKNERALVPHHEIESSPSLISAAATAWAAMALALWAE
jgi:hypothetical protein